MLALDDEITELMVEVPPGKVIEFDMPRLCSALGVTDPSCVAVETDGSRCAIITVYRQNPLAEIRAVTREDLVMDRRGYITVGRYHNGRPARKRLFDPSTGSAQRFGTFGTTGAGKSRSVQLDLIAEKVNGIISWLSDLKGGQSNPEAQGHVDWWSHTPEAALLSLRSAGAVTEARMLRYSRMGRTAFLPGRPDRLLHVRIAECNRLLEPGSPYRDEATYWIKELGRTGRSLGVGIGIDAQAGHLEELGGSDTLRGMIKEGEMVLLRWSSTMMQQLVTDGLLPAGTQLMPISKTLRTPRLVSQFDAVHDDDEDDGPGTQGSAYLLSGPHPTSLMRHFRVGSIKPLPGLDPEILALYGDDEAAHLEKESWEAAGPAYAARNAPDAMAELCAQVVAEYATDAVTIPLGTSNTAFGAAPRAAAGTTATLLDDRILAVLQDADEPMTADDVLAAVLADGGRAVKLGSVRNALISLIEDGDAARTERGLYTAT